MRSRLEVLEMIDYVKLGRELAAARAIVKRLRFIDGINRGSMSAIGMVKPKFGPDRDERARPPTQTDGMFRVQCRISGAVAVTVIKQLVSDREKEIWRNPVHRVVECCPFLCKARMNRDLSVGVA